MSGQINIEFKSTSDNYEMLISDNGIGIPENSDVFNSNSLGLELIHSLVDQLDGEVKISSKNGTIFQIIFPHT
ncbi:MAG: sensor histidine kinase [Flavobacteriales bacterium]|nr:sensor histidine kinase [Flavobacteriales bacterium]